MLLYRVICVDASLGVKVLFSGCAVWAPAVTSARRIKRAGLAVGAIFPGSGHGQGFPSNASQEHPKADRSLWRQRRFGIVPQSSQLLTFAWKVPTRLASCFCDHPRISRRIFNRSPNSIGTLACEVDYVTAELGHLAVYLGSLHGSLDALPGFLHLLGVVANDVGLFEFVALLEGGRASDQG